MKAKGYVSLGFSPNGGMEGADIFLAWIKEDNQVAAQVLVSLIFYANQNLFFFFVLNRIAMPRESSCQGLIPIRILKFCPDLKMILTP